jgi:CDP-diacylglycerol---glycerol-3-phosphate 3-phosphatidyltransferase
MKEQIFTFPTILTLIRLVISPLFLPILLVGLLPYDIFWLNVVLAGFFVLLSLTDFFDGYLARKFHQETMLGRFLDPMADKFLFFSVLIALLVVKKIFFYWVIIFIAREFFVLGLRIFALEHALTIPVSWRGKIKTVIQMTYATVAISNPYHHWSDAIFYNSLEYLLLALALVATWWSAYHYYTAFGHAYRMRYHDNVSL